MKRSVEKSLCPPPGPGPPRPSQTDQTLVLACLLPASPHAALTRMTFTRCAGSARLSPPSGWARRPSPCSFDTPHFSLLSLSSRYIALLFSG